MTNLPKEGESQRIGRLAKRALANQLPDNWIEKELDGDSDYGIDYLIQLKNNDSHVEFSFYLQLKGTQSPKYDESKAFISHSFKTSTLEYYLRQDPLVMVAIVDIVNERRLYECPIYYFWLDDEWFRQNFDKLKNKKTISIQIPISNNLNQDLDIYDFYVSRFREKQAFSELKKGISDQNKSIPETVEFLAKRITEKPIFLKSIENQSEAPWIDNPKGEVVTELKICSDYFSNNRIQDAKQLLNMLDLKKEGFSEYELAEFYFQKGNLLSCEGRFDDAEKNFELAQNFDQRDRYRIAYNESKFKLNSMPSPEELEVVVTTFDDDSLEKCMLKAKALALLQRPSAALELLRLNYPSAITAQIVICTISEQYVELDEIISKNLVTKFGDEREEYIFNSLAARRYFYLAAYQPEVDVYGEIIPFYGRPNYDLLSIKQALNLIRKAWVNAKKMGYPRDIILLMDISPLIYGYFGKLDELSVYIEEVLLERPNNFEIIKPYIPILFSLGRYNKLIEYIKRIEKKDYHECEMEILSYYFLEKPKQCLKLIEDYEEDLLHSPNDNTAEIFCIGIEIADAIFRSDIVEKYEKIVISLKYGAEFLEIQKFVKKSKEDRNRSDEFIQELYQSYLRLDKSLVIADQLMEYLSPHDKVSAHQLIEISEEILAVRELNNDNYFNLAQAMFTTEKWKDVERLAEKRIEKGVALSKWKFIQAIALQNQGKVGVAYKVISDVVKEGFSNSEQENFYISLCLSLGLIDNAIEFLEGNLVSENNKENKIVTIRKLIAIYANKTGYENNIKAAILKYGELIDQNNCEQEGDYLQLCIRYNPFDCDEKIKNYQIRSNKYFDTFPESTILRKASVNLEGGADSLLASLRKLTGVTLEQEQIWESNKQKLRRREFPIPFCMRGYFLQNTRDVYTTWMFSKHSKDEELEFKVIHAPQSGKDNFFELIDNSNIIIFEETSLLILNDLSLLDSFLKVIPKFSILESVFKKINLTTHEPISINSQISSNILKAIQNNLEKLQLINDEKKDFKYDCDLNDERVLLLTDDLYLACLVKQQNSNVSFGNVFNVLEFLFHRNILSEDEFHEHIVNFLNVGIIDVSMRVDFLGELINYHLGKTDVENYEDTGFKCIFDKMLIQKSNFRDKQKLFLDMFSWVDISDLSPDALISLIRKLLEDHPMFDPQNVVNTWFVYCGLKREILKDTDTSVSKIHEDLWLKYKQVIGILNSTKYSNEILLRDFIKVTENLDKNISVIVLNNLKASFSPDTNEYKYLETII